MYIKVSIPEHFQLKIMPSLYSLMFRRENDVHYIGGAEVLPAPLDAKGEAECIENLGEEDGEAQEMPDRTQSASGGLHSEKI